MFHLKWEPEEGHLGPTTGLIRLHERVMKELQQIGEKRERPVVVQCL